MRPPLEKKIKWNCGNLWPSVKTWKKALIKTFRSTTQSKNNQRAAPQSDLRSEYSFHCLQGNGGGLLIRLGLPRHFKCTPVIMKNLKTFHPDTQRSQTEPETAVWKNNWTICDSLSRAILSAHYCTLVPVKTGWLRFDFEPPSPNRSLELPLSFHPPFGFYKKKKKKGPCASLQRRVCITSDSCQQQLDLQQEKIQATLL